MNDEYWFPLYEKLCELNVPMQIHSSGCYSDRETYSEHFITEESIAILSMIRGNIFKHFPELRVIVSHGGGSVPYQLGRWQSEIFHPELGEGKDATPFEDRLRQFYFDTVLHYPLALELLFKTVGSDRILFGTERPGSGSAINPTTGAPYDDLKPIIDGFKFLSESDRSAVFEDNARQVFPRLKI
jgi:4-oxalmesaconate hydratase